jgi:hypothetical protein
MLHLPGDSRALQCGMEIAAAQFASAPLPQGPGAGGDVHQVFKVGSAARADLGVAEIGGTDGAF